MNALAWLLGYLSYGRRWLCSRGLRRATPTLRKLIRRMWMLHWRIRLGAGLNGLERDMGNIEEDLTIVKAGLD